MLTELIMGKNCRESASRHEIGDKSLKFNAPKEAHYLPWGRSPKSA
jgi:hypothetical protein